MESKDEIVRNWQPRYTGAALEDFGMYILLTNFSSGYSGLLPSAEEIRELLKGL